MKIYVWDNSNPYDFETDLMIVLANSISEARGMRKERLLEYHAEFLQYYDTDALVNQNPEIFELDKPVLFFAYHEG